MNNFKTTSPQEGKIKINDQKNYTQVSTSSSSGALNNNGNIYQKYSQTNLLRENIYKKMIQQIGSYNQSQQSPLLQKQAQGVEQKKNNFLTKNQNPVIASYRPPSTDNVHNSPLSFATQRSEQKLQFKPHYYVSQKNQIQQVQQKSDNNNNINNSGSLQNTVKQNNSDILQKSNIFKEKQNIFNLQKSRPATTKLDAKLENNKLDQYVTRVKNNYANPHITSQLNLKLANMNNSIDKSYRSCSPPNTKIIYYKTNVVQSWKNPLKLSSLSALFREHVTQTLVGVKFCLGLTPAPHSVIENLRIKMQDYNPRLKFRKTVVFDLDETLVHCVEDTKAGCDFKVNIVFPTGDQVEAGINVRPFALELLKQLNEVCEIILFTASHSCYASKVIEKIDPKSEIFSKVLFRDKCVVTPEGVHVKDIRVIGRDIKNIVLVDNATYSFGPFLNNGIPIIPFYENKLDTELRSLYEFLINDVLPSNDVRTVLSKHFQFNEWNKYTNAKDIILNLYDK